jgi:hypothetical protein
MGTGVLEAIQRFDLINKSDSQLKDWRTIRRALCEYGRLLTLEETWKKKHPQPAKCLGCEYWQGPCGNCCMRGDSEESCIKVGTLQAVRPK